ncbi:MAG: HD domain-containing protein [Planctomycetota bacterium]
MIPELELIENHDQSIRLPHQINVPVSKRVLSLVDSPQFQRLAQVSQLGLVSLVYPGGKHTRFEHSLGVYRNALLFLNRLGGIEKFNQLVTPQHCEAMLVAALLHDLGHWPYCHLMEDMGLHSIPKHESLAVQRIRDSGLGRIITQQWNCDVELVCRLIQNSPESKAEQLLCSILSGPIDIDKLDYLYRDSLHCGVPYGMNFDSSRLIQSVCLNRASDGIAIHSKGKTAAEMMVFARYVMFNEVYWHHAVRSASAMLQKCCFLALGDEQKYFTPLQEICRESTDHNFGPMLNALPGQNTECVLFQSLFGTQRILYKRVGEFNAGQNRQLFDAIAHQPYATIQVFNRNLAAALSTAAGQRISEDEVLIDAPPMGLEVQFKVEINDGQTGTPLESVSPVVSALATEQFDAYVKKIRVFVHPRVSDLFAPDDVKSCLFESTQL